MEDSLAGGPSTLTCPDGATIAYRQLAGKSPTVLFLPGFKSDMTGAKALCAEALCRARGQAFVRLDYRGHGESSGDFLDGTIGQWAGDVVAALDQLTEGPVVLVGSSMGGWLMVLAALARPHRIAAMLGLAAAPDFTEDLIRGGLSRDQLARIDKLGSIDLANDYDDGDPYTITKALLDEARDHLVLARPIKIDCPVRLIHGQKDEDVPYETSLRLARQLTSVDVEVTLVKEAGHRLSEDEDLARLKRTLGALLDGL